MTGEGTTPEIPPGLLEEYLAGMRVLLELLVAIADRLTAVPGDKVALEELRRETHKIHGSAGSYGFSGVSRLAAGMEETVKDWVARPDDRDADRGSLTRWFVGRLTEMLGLGGPAREPAQPPHRGEGQIPQGFAEGRVPLLPRSEPVALAQVFRADDGRVH